MDKESPGLFSPGSDEPTSGPEPKTIGLIVAGIAVFLGLIVIVIMSRGSNTVSTDSGPSGTVVSGPNDVKPPQSAGCSALEGFLFADLAAKQGAAGSPSPAQQDQTVTQLTNAAKTLKQRVPQLTAAIDARLTYITKIVKGAPDASAEKDAGDKALSELNGFKLNVCAPMAFPGGGAGGGGGVTTTVKP